MVYLRNRDPRIQVLARAGRSNGIDRPLWPLHAAYVAAHHVCVVVHPLLL